MAIYKRYKGRRLKRSDRDWDKGTWWIEFSLRGSIRPSSIPRRSNSGSGGTSREPNAEKRSMNGRSNPGKKLFSEFVDETFLTMVESEQAQLPRG